MLPSPTAQRRAVLVLLASLVCAAAAAVYGSGLQTDNRVESWAEAVAGDEDYELLLERFGGDFLVLARFAGVEAGDPRHDEFFAELTERLDALPGSERVLDPYGLPGSQPQDLGEALDLALTRPLGRSLELTDEGRLDAYVVIDDDAGPEESLAFDEGFRALRSEAEALGLDVTAAGHPFMTAALDRESRVVDRVYAPLLVLVGLLVCAGLLRSLPLGLVALLPGIFGALAVRAALRLVGVPSNMILVAAGPLVFVVMVASMVHLVSAWRRFAAAGMAPEEAARAARRATLRPALVAAATTAAGFGVFVTSDVSAVRELGLTVALAVAVLVPLSYAIMPLVLAGVAVVEHREAQRGPVRRIAAGALRTRPVWFAATAVVLAAGALAPRSLPVAVSAIEYFPAEHPIREEYFALDDGSAGLSSLDVLVRVSDAPVDAAAAARLASVLGAVPGVGSVFGPPQVLEDLRVVGPTAMALAPHALRELGRLGSEGEWLRWSARGRANTAEEIETFTAGIREAALGWASAEGRDVRVAGSLLQLNAMQVALVGTLAQSLALTGLVALLSFLFFLRGTRQVVTAIVANLVPVAFVLAGARMLGYALDAATCVVASAVVGLALDNTFHLLLAAGEGGDAPARARLGAFDRVGGAAVAGILVLAAGFACLAIADFQPTARFGALAGLGVLGALFADLAVIPALWLVSPKRRTSPAPVAVRTA